MQDQQSPLRKLYSVDSVTDERLVASVKLFQSLLMEEKLKEINADTDKARNEGKDLKLSKKEALLKLLGIKLETHGAIKSLHLDNKPVKVTEQLYIGSIGSAMHLDNLKEAGITHVICCIDRDFRPYPEDFTYLNVAVTDSPSSPIEEYFEKAIEFVGSQPKDSKFLIHCFAGISRSSTILCSILIKLHSHTFDSALTLIQSSRPKANPNSGFRQKLLDYSSAKVVNN